MSRRPLALVSLAVGTSSVAVLLALVVLALPARDGDVTAPSGPGGGPALTDPVDRYVALGDSFTAGPLIPYVDTGRTACLRSSANYPAVLGAWLDARRVVDVSCSGADTTDLLGTGEGLGGPAPPQLAAVTADTDLVTLGTGGNDFGIFGSLVGRCPSLAAEDRSGTPCRESFIRRDGSDRLLDRMPAVERRLVAALAATARRAPDAVIAVVGYPRILPASGSCAALPFAAGDYAWVDRVERALNAALSAAARRADAVYVDTYGASRGHDACAGPDAWVNGQDTRPIEALAYHPYASGMLGAASEAYTALTDQPPTAAQRRQADRLAQWRPPGTLTLRGQRFVAALVSGR